MVLEVVMFTPYGVNAERIEHLQVLIFLYIFVCCVVVFRISRRVLLEIGYKLMYDVNL